MEVKDELTLAQFNLQPLLFLGVALLMCLCLSQKAKSKVHDGLCQRCKDVVEWKVKYNKYKPITQPRKW